jgi:endo-1,4-beta-xylanase
MSLQSVNVPPVYGDTASYTNEHKQLLLNYNFQNGIPNDISERGPSKIKIVKKDGIAVAYVFSRKEDWHGLQVDLTKYLKSGKEYRITAEVMQTKKESEMINVSFDIVKGGKRAYPVISDISSSKNQWSVVHRKVRVEPFDSIALYFQVIGNSTMSFYIKSIQIEEVVYSDDALAYESLYKLADKYNFYFGTVVCGEMLDSPEIKKVVSKHFNSITAENEMKSELLLDQQASIINARKGSEKPKLDFSKADKIADFAVANGMRMRGHTLVYGQATPDWFFREGYESDGSYVDRETMLIRMESYIKQVLSHFQTKYPGLIYTWDVVNEAIGIDIWTADPHGDYPISMGVKTDPFYVHIGSDYVKKAFEYARKYADKDIKLFYNDWGCYDKIKKDAICYLINQINDKEKLIDGIGMQSYMNIDDVLLTNYSEDNYLSFIDALNAFHDLGMEIQLTEMTVKTYSKKEYEAQGIFYYKLFQVIKELNKKETIISCVSTWNMMDRDIQAGDPGFPEWQYSGFLTSNLELKPAFKKIYLSLREMN